MTDIHPITRMHWVLSDYHYNLHHPVPVTNAYAIRRRKRLINTALSEKQIMDKITQIVCDIYKIPVERIFEKNRRTAVINARQVIVYLIQQLFSNITATDTGKYFKQDHTTILHARKRINNLIDTEEEFSAQVQRIKLIVTDKFKEE